MTAVDELRKARQTWRLKAAIHGDGVLLEIAQMRGDLARYALWTETKERLAAEIKGRFPYANRVTLEGGNSPQPSEIDALLAEHEHLRAALCRMYNTLTDHEGYGYISVDRWTFAAQMALDGEG